MTAADYRHEEPASPEPAPAITEAWGQLWAWAAAQRRDWDGSMVKAAMRGADSRGVPYRLAWETLSRLAWNLDADTRAVLGELTNLNRGPAPRGAAPASVLEALRAGNYEAARAVLGTESVVPPEGRITGGQPVLRDVTPGPAEGESR